MIDLTPLDVRKKHEDFKRILRGFDPQEVQTFLEMVAERMEELVRENLQLRERSTSLEQQVSSQTGREQAVQDALVTAQELRGDIQRQAHREAELVLSEAQTEARRLLAEAEAEVRSLMRDAQRKLDQGADALHEMERRRIRFLKAFRQLLEREIDVVEVEEARAPLEERAIELELGGGRPREDAMAVELPEPELPETPAPSQPPVDESAAERPPLDVPIDELAASYGSSGDQAPDAAPQQPGGAPEAPGATAAEGQSSFPSWDAPASQDVPEEASPGKPADPTLFNSLEEDDSGEGDRWG